MVQQHQQQILQQIQSNENGIPPGSKQWKYSKEDIRIQEALSTLTEE